MMARKKGAIHGGKFVIKETKTGFKFDLKASNGEIIACSEVYTTLQSCKAGIASVVKNAPTKPNPLLPNRCFAAAKNRRKKVKAVTAATNKPLCRMAQRLFFL